MHSLTRVAVICPEGVILAFSPPYEGRKNDMQVAASSHLNSHLQVAGLKAIADKGLAADTCIKPLPKKSQNHPFSYSELKRLAAIRTAAVEWPFGTLQQTFNFLTQKCKQKIYQTNPDMWLVVATILSNCIRTERGSNNHVYFDVIPSFTVEDYLEWEE